MSNQKKHGGGRNNAGKKRINEEDLDTQFIEKRTTHSWTTLTTYISDLARDNYKIVMEEKRMEWIQIMDHIIETENNVCGYVTQIEELDWRKYRFPERIWIARHLMLTVEWKEKNYRQHWYEYLLSKGFRNFDLTCGHPSYPAYHLVYIFKDEHYRCPEVECIDNGWMQKIEKMKEEHDKYPVSYRVESKDYDNKEQMTLGQYTIDGWITEKVRNIFTQQHIMFRLGRGGVALVFEKDEDCVVKGEILWLHGWLLKQEPRYANFLNYHWKRVVKLLEDPKRMVCDLRDFYIRDCGHELINFSQLDPIDPTYE